MKYWTFSVLFCCLITAITARLEVKDMKITPVKSALKSKIVRANCLDELEGYLLKYFSDIDNVILCEDTRTVIVNKLRLNAAYSIVGEEFMFAKDIEEGDSYLWVEVRNSGVHTELAEGLPLTGCLSSDGGLIGGSFSITLSQSASYDFPLSYQFTNMLSGSLDNEISLAASFGVSASFSCTVAAGNVGQVFFQPFYTEIEEPEMRYIKLLRGRTWRRPSRILPKSIEYSEWEPITTSVRLNALFSKPVLTCVTDELKLKCLSNVVEDYYHF